MDRITIVNGYTRKRHWEIVYHDLMDLYGPMIGPDGVGMWITYKRYVNHDPEHILADRAWPSHRGLAGMYGVGRNSLASIRQRLETAGLISVTAGRDLAHVNLSQLASIGIQNPAATLIIEVNDPLPFDAFCEEFDLSYCPRQVGGRWAMYFEEYDGRILGPNRLAAAVGYIEDHIRTVTGEQIRSLLRCSPDDRQTIAIRDRLLARHRLVGGSAPQRRPTNLPDDVLNMLARLGWQGSLNEVEELYQSDRDFLYRQLAYWLERQGDVNNAAAALRESLRSAPREEPDELEDLPY